MSRSTVVNTLPWGLSEPKPGLTPSLYEMGPAERGDISVLIVEDAFQLYHVPLSDGPPIRIPVASGEVARGICQDYISSSIFTSYEDKGKGVQGLPGLFWVDGGLSSAEVKKNYPREVAAAIANTMEWFKILVTIADDDWQKFGIHKMITDIQRKACSYLKIDRDWNVDVLARMSAPTCWGCKSVVAPGAIICPACHAILDSVEYEKKKSMFVAR